jgi:hypothetical protein
MNAQDQEDTKDGRECHIKEGPEVLGIHVPTCNLNASATDHGSRTCMLTMFQYARLGKLRVSRKLPGKNFNRDRGNI